MASQRSQDEGNNEKLPGNSNNDTHDHSNQAVPDQQALINSRRDLAQTYTRTLQDINTGIATLVQQSNNVVQQTLQRNNRALQLSMERIQATFNRMIREVDANDRALIRNGSRRLTSPLTDRPLPNDRRPRSDDEVDRQSPVFDEVELRPVDPSAQRASPSHNAPPSRSASPLQSVPPGQRHPPSEGAPPSQQGPSHSQSSSSSQRASRSRDAIKHAVNTGVDPPSASRSEPGEAHSEQQPQAESTVAGPTDADRSRGSSSVEEVAEPPQPKADGTASRRRKDYYVSQAIDEDPKTLGLDRKPEDNPENIIGQANEGRRTRNSQPPPPTQLNSTLNDGSRPASAKITKGATAKAKSSRKRGPQEGLYDTIAEEAELNQSNHPGASHERQPSKKQKQKQKQRAASDDDDAADATADQASRRGNEMKEEPTEAASDSRGIRSPVMPGTYPDNAFSRNTVGLGENASWGQVQAATRPTTVTNSQGAHRYPPPRGGRALQRYPQARPWLQHVRPREGGNQNASDHSSKDNRDGYHHGEDSDDED